MQNATELEEVIFQKKHWIPVTHLCNNNCVFCLMDRSTKTHHRSFDEIKAELDNVSDKKNTRLVVSGGDPTIHPRILDIIAYGKTLNFSYLQMITNGRLFAYRNFSDSIIAAGVKEVTFSINGHTPT